MSYITLGSWNKNYLYIIVSSLCWLVYEAFNGLGYYFNTINLGDPRFNGHIYIHKLFYYLLILICSLLFSLYEKKVNKTKNDDELELNKIRFNTFFASQKIFGAPIISNKNIFLILFLYVLFEFIDQFVKQFFFFGDFWMLELIIMAYLCYKMLMLKIYSHQRLAIYLVSIPFLLKTITIILLFCDENNHLKNGEINYKYNDETTFTKSLFVAHWWLLPISFIAFFIIMSINSYTFINIKKIIDIKYISLTKILVLYGAFGTVLSTLFLAFSTIISCGKKNYDVYDIWDYQCFVVDNNDDRFIDSYKVYFSQNIWKDLLFTLIRGLAVFFHRFFFWKYIQYLNPIFKIFSYPLIYALEKIIVLYKFDGEEQMKFLNLRFYLDFCSDIAAFIGFLIYLEIIELNFCYLDKDLRKNIIKRSKSESVRVIELDTISLNEGEEETNEYGN